MRPIFFGPFAVFVLWVGAEVEDVLLSNAEMFDEHPGGVWEVCGLCAAEVGREIFYDVVEGGVGLASGEEFEEMLAEGSVGSGSFFPGRHFSSAQFFGALSLV
jgi:hypothetical protein